MRLSRVLLAILCLLSASSAQWVERTIPLTWGALPLDLCYNSVDHRVYCANQYGDSVVVIDASADTIVAKIPARGQPTTLCYNPLHDRLYCTGFAPESVAVISGATNAVLAVLPGGSAQSGICYNWTNDKMYCSNAVPANSVTVIDGAGDSIITTIPVGSSPGALCFNPVDDKVYSASSDDSTVSIISGASDRVITTLHAGGQPVALCFNRASDRAYCANFTTDDVTVIDGAGDFVMATIPVDTHPFAFCYDSLDNRVFCATWVGTVDVIDGRTNALLDTIRTSLVSGHRGLSYEPTNDRVFCTNTFGVPAYVSVIDAATHAITETLAVGTQPRAMTWNPVENRTYVASYGNHTIAVIRDSNGTAVCEPLEASRPVSNVGPSIVRGVLRLNAAASLKHPALSWLLTASGRRVMVLRPGSNDVRRLAPGVYFVRSSLITHRSSLVEKVIVTR